LDGFANFSAEHQHLAPEKMGGFRVRVGLRQKLPVPVTIRAIWAEIREEMLKMHAEFEKSGIFLGSCNRIDCRIGIDHPACVSARFADLRQSRGSRFRFFVLLFKSLSSADGAGLGDRC
jgi:hypothetical protein